MPFVIEKSEKTEFEQVKPGTHLAICYKVMWLGEVESTYNGETKKQTKIRFYFELPNSLTSGGAPMSIRTRAYGATLYDTSTLYKDLALPWGMPILGIKKGEMQSFDFEKLIGKAAFIGVQEQEGKDKKMYTIITSIQPPMGGMQIPPMLNTPVSFNPSNFMEAFPLLNKKEQEEFLKSSEGQANYTALLASLEPGMPF